MADNPRLDGRTLLLTAVVGVIGLCFIGGGPVNGDQAVYLFQAAEHLWFERWTHVGYVGLLGLLGANSTAADLLNVAFGCGAVALLGHRTGWKGAALTAGAVLPWLPWGEVDLAWFFFGVLSLEMAWAGGLSLLCSPTALAGAGLLWLTKRRAAWVMGGVAAGVAMLSGGDWVVGNRGVLILHWDPAPLTQLAWLVVPVLLSIRGFEKSDYWMALGLTPVLLAPSDVPAFLWAIPFLATRVRASAWMLAVHLVVGGFGLGQRRSVVEEERLLVTQGASVVEAGDALESSWSVAVRVSLQIEGRPDALIRHGHPGYCNAARRWRLSSGELPLLLPDCR